MPIVSVPGFFSASLSGTQCPARAPGGADAVEGCRAGAVELSTGRRPRRRAAAGGRPGRGRVSGACAIVGPASPPAALVSPDVRPGHICNSLHRGRRCGSLRPMALEHAILVSLSERPASGLDLTRRFDRSIGFFWSATHQQIYRVLAPDGRRRLGALDARSRSRAGPTRRSTPSPPAGRRELARLDRRSHPVGAVPQRGRGQAPRRVVRRPGGRARPGRGSTAPSTRPGSRTTSSSPRDYPDPGDPRPGHDLDVYLVLRGGIRLEQFWVDWLTEYLDRPPRPGALT